MISVPALLQAQLCAMAEKKTAYELQREARIAANKQKIAVSNNADWATGLWQKAAFLRAAAL